MARIMYIPGIKFSAWMKWTDRKKYPYSRFPGIYIIAITRKNLEGKKPMPRYIAYIGMSNSKSGLRGRWDQFDQCIRGKKYGSHSGGWCVNSHLGDYKKWEKRYRLYVAAMPLKRKITVDKKSRKPKDIVNMGLVAFLEYLALAEYKRKTGREPEYNTK